MGCALLHADIVMWTTRVFTYGGMSQEVAIKSSFSCQMLSPPRKISHFEVEVVLLLSTGQLND